MKAYIKLAGVTLVSSSVYFVIFYQVDLKTPTHVAAIDPVAFAGYLSFFFSF